MNIYSMNDCDWVAAASPEEAIAFYLREVADGKDTPENREEYIEEPIEALAAEHMEKLRYHDSETGKVRSFAEQLALEISEGKPFPSYFASTEY